MGETTASRRWGRRRAGVRPAWPRDYTKTQSENGLSPQTPPPPPPLRRLGLRTSPLPGRGPGLLSGSRPSRPSAGASPPGRTLQGLGASPLGLGFNYLLCNLLFFLVKGHTSSLSPREGRTSAGSAAAAVRPAGRAPTVLPPPARGPGRLGAGWAVGAARGGGGVGGEDGRPGGLLFHCPSNQHPPALPGVCVSLSGRRRR